MIKLIHIFVFTFLFVFTAKSQEIDPDNLHNLFWKIEHPKGKKTSYLFGTIHLIDKDLFVLPKIIQKKISKADALYIELSDLEDKSQGLELTMMKEGRMTDILSNEQRDSVYMYTKDEFGMDSSAFEKVFGKFKPLVFSQLALAKLLVSAKSYDKTIGEIAKENEVPIIGFETLNEQMSFFDDMSKELKIELIMRTVRNSDSGEEDWINMQQLYVEQNIPKMMEIGESTGEMADFMNNTITKNRNEKWVSELVQELPNAKLFVAVGAAHLNGNTGLIQLLINEGFILTPISIDLNKTP